MNIYAPVKDFNGMRNNVRFVNGIGKIDNPVLIKWFVEHGYQVEDNYVKPVNNVVISTENKRIDDIKNENNVDNIEPEYGVESLRVEQSATVQPELVVEDVGEDNQPDFDSMTPNELRDWAKANGLGGVIRNTRNKEKLLEIIRG